MSNKALEVQTRSKAVLDLRIRARERIRHKKIEAIIKKSSRFCIRKGKKQKKRKAEALKFGMTNECPLLWVGK